MNTIWLKIAGLAVVAVIVIVVLGRFGGNKPESEPRAPQTESKPAQKNKTFDQMVARDKQLGQVPQPAEPQPAEAPQPAPAQPPAPQPAVPMPPTTSELAAKGIFLPSAITQPMTLFFKPLSEEEEVAAEQLLPWATATRSIGRLPMMSYGPMVRTCRDILTRWPDSRYAFRAKQMLEDISASGRSTGFNITPQEMDISRFLKPRQGTQPFTVEPLRR
jgi:hypothetical protein